MFLLWIKETDNYSSAGCIHFNEKITKYKILFYD